MIGFDEGPRLPDVARVRDDVVSARKEGLRYAGDDFYTRAAYADLLLRHGRDADTLRLLGDYRSMEPMLLRVAIAETRTGDSQSVRTDAFLSNAFAVEEQRGDAVHRREQARFLLDVEQQPTQALAAAQENWWVQREPDDAAVQSIAFKI